MLSVWSYIAEQFTGMDFWDTIQTIGLILSFIYLWLEFHQKPLMWIISAMCSMIYASVYFHSKIYADMGFSCFNICMCVYGFIKWLHSDRKRASHGTEGKGGIIYRHFRAGEFMAVLGVAALIWTAIFCILRFLTDSPVPALDALTTMLNIVGTWVLAQKIIEESKSLLEASSVIQNIAGLIVPPAYALFDTDKIITKVPMYAIERQKGFEASGFTKSEEFMIGTNDKYAYKDY